MVLDPYLRRALLQEALSSSRVMSKLAEDDDEDEDKGSGKKSKDKEKSKSKDKNKDKDSNAGSGKNESQFGGGQQQQGGPQWQQPQPQQWFAQQGQQPQQQQPQPPPQQQQAQPQPRGGAGQAQQPAVIIHCASDCANLVEGGVCGLTSVAFQQLSPGGSFSCAQYRSTGGVDPMAMNLQPMQTGGMGQSQPPGSSGFTPTGQPPAQQGGQGMQPGGMQGWLAPS